MRRKRKQDSLPHASLQAPEIVPQDVMEELAGWQRLQKISLELITQDRVEALYEQILHAATTVIQSDMASLQRLCPERGKPPGELELLGSVGFAPETVEAFRWVGPSTGCVCGETFRTGNRVMVEDIETCAFLDPPSLAALRQSGIRAVQTTPLRTRSGRLVGMFSTHWRHPHRLADWEVRLCDMLARQAADLIERTQIEAARRMSEAQFRTMADWLPLIVWVHDAEGRQEFVNRTFCEYFGITPDMTKDSQWEGFMHPDDADAYREEFFACLRDRRPFHGQVRVRNAHGDWRWLESWGRPRLAETGNFLGFVGTSADITERKQAEEALRENEVRLQTFADQLEHLVEERTTDLLQSQERLRALASELNLAEQRERKRLATELHDHLQQLLILGKLKLGQGMRSGQPFPDYGDVMQQVDDILSDALTYTRTLVADLSPPVLRDHGLPAALKWLAQDMKNRNLMVSVTMPDHFCLKIPEDQLLLLFQSVRELLINASKYAGTGEATVALIQKEDRLHIEVRDDGVGFNPAAVGRSQQSFTKFGLFSIGERMQSLGGAFHLESAPGKGATAILSLPTPSVTGRQGLPEGRIAQEVEEVRQVEGNTARTSDRRKPQPTKVLLVDDHAMVRQGLRSVLAGYDHVEVVGEAADGLEAVKAVVQLRPQVVVMDINMPKMNGLEATARIKADYPDVIVIGLSMHVGDANQEAMRHAGACMLIPKEAAVERLYSSIHEAVKGLVQLPQSSSKMIPDMGVSKTLSKSGSNTPDLYGY